MTPASESREEGSEWRVFGAVLLLWAALYLPYLGSNELRGEEARRILPAETMLQTGDWVVPRIGGEEYSSKPPLINWMIAASFWVTGVENEWTARLPTVLWLLAYALVATVLLRERFGLWPAAWAGLFFLSAFGMLDKGRTAEIDAMYAAQTGIAYVMWAVWWSQGRRWLAFTIPWIVLGLGLLAKGPAHLLFVYAAVVAALWTARRRRELLSGAHVTGLLLMAAVFLPWLVANLQQVEQVEETSGTWWQQLSVRFSYGDIDWGDWLQLPFQMVKDYLPWSILLILLWRRPPRREVLDAPAGSRWISVMAGTKFAICLGVILLSLSPEMRPRYAMPLFGMASVLLVELWGRLEPGERFAKHIEGWWRRLNRWMVWALPLGGLAAVIVAWRLEETAAWMALPGLLATGALWYGRERAGSWPPLVGSCLNLAVAQVLVFQFAGPWEDRRGLYRPVAREVSQLLPDDSRELVWYQPGHLRFLFYLQHPYREVTELDPEGTAPAGYLAVPERQLDAAPVQELFQSREAKELGRREIERRRFVFFELGSPRRPVEARTR